LNFPGAIFASIGFIKGKQVISKSLSGAGVDRKFTLLPDDRTLNADGADTTRVVLRVTDEFNAIRTNANDPITFTLSGPAEIIGDNPFALIGGTGAIWIRAKEMPGTARLTAKHPRLGTQTIEFHSDDCTEGNRLSNKGALERPLRCPLPRILISVGWICVCNAIKPERCCLKVAPQFHINAVRHPITSTCNGR
jgi:hypothetical protein